jgi:hypothetical protein
VQTTALLPQFWLESLNKAVTSFQWLFVTQAKEKDASFRWRVRTIKMKAPVGVSSDHCVWVERLPARCPTTTSGILINTPGIHGRPSRLLKCPAPLVDRLENLIGGVLRVLPPLKYTDARRTPECPNICPNMFYYVRAHNRCYCSAARTNVVLRIVMSTITVV